MKLTYIISILLIFYISISLTSAIICNPNIQGGCPKESTGVINNNISNVNNTYINLTANITSTCASGYVAQNISNNVFQCVPLSLGTYNSTYDITSKDVTANRSNWFSTYNVTYAGLINNASYLSTYNVTYAGNLGNSSFNQSSTDSLYARIQWGYNMTTPALNFRNWLNYNANTSQTSEGFGYNVQTMSMLNDSLVSWWRMDDLNSSGGVVDYMGRNNGTAYGNASQVSSGKFGKGFVFDGDGDYIFISPSTSLNNLQNNVSFSLWVYSTVNESDYSNYYKSLVQFRFNSSHYFSCLFKSTQYGEDNGLSCVTILNGTEYDYNFNTCKLPKNNWAHIAIVLNDTRIFAYKNNVLCGVLSLRLPFSNLNDGFNTYIGSAIASSYSWNGTIDEVMIFNRSLSASEIQALYNSSKYALYKNQTNLNQSLNYTMYVQDINASIITCLDNQCPATGGTVITTNATLHFNDTVIFAKDFVVMSRLYSGDALSLINNIKSKSTGNLFEDIDYGKSSGLTEGELGFSTMLKAIQQLNTKLEEKDKQILDLQSNLTSMQNTINKLCALAPKGTC